MNRELFTLGQQNLRGTDSNSLLRLIDQANGVLQRSSSQQERARAARAIERITRELERRKGPA